jgi:hypothetical protein
MEEILAKNEYTTNLITRREETVKHKDPAFDSALSPLQFPDIELITRSLRKIDLIISTAHILWPKNGTAEKIVADSVEIINQTCQRKFSFYNGKALKCILAGLFYILGFRYDDPKKQRKIGGVFQITDVTVRSSYKQWLKDFPDLFQDVITILNQKPCHCLIG